MTEIVTKLIYILNIKEQSVILKAACIYWIYKTNTPNEIQSIL